MVLIDESTKHEAVTSAAVTAAVQHQDFQLFMVLATRHLSSAAGQSVTSPQPWPGYKCTAIVQ